MRPTPAFIIVFLWLLGSTLDAKPLEQVSLQLHWEHQFQFAGYYMAKEKGFYKAADLDVEIREMRHLHNIADDVDRGLAHYGTGRSQLLIERSQGKKIVLLAPIFQSSPIVLITKKSADIKSIADLSGKRFSGAMDIIDDIAIISMIGGQKLDNIGSIITDSKNRISDFLNDDVDALVVYHSNEYYTLEESGTNLKVIDPKDHGFDFYSDILFTSEDEVYSHRYRALAMKDASLQGWEYVFEHIEETIDLIMQKYNSQGKSRDALLYEAHALRELAYYKTENIGVIDKERITQTYADFKRAGLISKKLDLDTFILTELKTESEGITFTQEEKNYLASKDELVICSTSDWLPYLGNRGKTTFGIVHDYFQVFAEKIGLAMRFDLVRDLDSCVQRLADGHADVISTIATTPELYSDITPSNSYGNDNVALVTPIDTPYINELHLYTGRVGISTLYQELTLYLEKKFPDLQIEEVSSTEDGLEKVADGRLDALIDMYQISTFTINNEYRDGLKVNTTIAELFIGGAVGIPSDEMLLRSIFNKAIDAFSAQEQAKIINSWIRTKKVYAPDYLLIGEVAAIALLIILALLYRQRFLQRHNHLLLKANESIKEQKEKIKEQKQVYELVFDNTTDGLLILSEGKFIDCNDAIVKVLNAKSKDDILSTRLAQFSPKYQPEDNLSSELSEKMIALAFKNRGHRFEWLHTRITGEEFWSEITLTPFLLNENELLYVVWRDISEAKELALQNSYLKERMELAFDGSQDGLWDWNLIDNSVYFSPRWKEMIGFKENEFDSDLETWRSRIHPEDIKEVLRKVTLTVNGEKDFFENKHRIRHKDGHWVWVYDRGTVQLNSDGKPFRMIGTHTDLTTEINLSNKLTELNRDLEKRVKYEVTQNLKKEELLMHQARLAQMGEMLSMIAHQWRQPLSAISAAISTLQLNNMLNQYDKTLFNSKLGNIAGYVQHLSRTINDFRSFFKEHKTMEETSLEEIVNSVLTITGPSLQDKGIALEYDFSANITFKTYVNEFKQVVLNLIKNAEDALIEKQTTDPQITIRTYLEGDTCNLEVSDNAGGVIPENLEHIFDLYFTTKERDGTGLGLYMSKMIIEDHCRGTITVHNSDHDAIFTIKVPL